MKLKDYIILAIILMVALIFRTYNLNWDSGGHMHPDERAITLFAVPLKMPFTLKEFLSVNSPLNPHFFAYGTLPIYLLKILGLFGSFFNSSYGNYESINLLGRFTSAVFDVGTVVILFIIGKKLFSKAVGFLSAVFYAIAVLPIQLAHFYAVDSLLTFFITLCLFTLILYYEKPEFKNSLLVGITLGLSFATKTSALALISSIGLALTVDFLLIFFSKPQKVEIWFPHVPRVLKVLFLDGLAIGLSALVVFLICEPYALIDFSDFWLQTQTQSQMTHNPFVFPYTYQFYGNIPYWYAIKNIFLWGLGPVFAILAFTGIFYFSIIAFEKQKHTKWAQELIIVAFFWSYFYVVGKFAVGYMRYMLPLYPILSISAALMLFKFIKKIQSILKKLHLATAFYIFTSCALLIWPLSFLHIYSLPNTRILATDWINMSIPSGKTLAVEHWDDRIPILGQDKYHILTFPLYDPDTPYKWSLINKQLSQTDYIILASNRLYIPLQKLTACNTLKLYCYPLTANYYQRLFNGQLGFAKEATFAVYPQIPFLNIQIDDQSADESFTVFDHPNIIIFKRRRPLVFTQ